MNTVKQFSYQYRGIKYKKTIPQRCLINLSQYKINKCDRENKIFTYRGVVYQVKQPKTITHSTTSAYVNKYRGSSYLTQIVDFLFPSKDITQSSTDNPFGDIDLIQY